MTDKIISYNFELEKINSELEERVEERTKELKNAKEKAEESGRIKSVFFTNMSHELRTPLMSILGNAEMLAINSESEQFKKMANNIAAGGQRLLKTLNSILDLSRLASDDEDFKTERIDVNECIINVMDQFRSAALKKNIAIEFVNMNGLSSLYTKKRYFTEIISNLVSNAVKFTERGRVVISFSDSDHSYQIEVEDTGIGIPPESQKIIFEEFRQVSEGFGRGFQGAGLGLAITKKIVSKMGGTISVNSTVDSGSKFTVKLPALQQG
jgi:signal transduction histidine kinase